MRDQGEPAAEADATPPLSPQFWLGTAAALGLAGGWLDVLLIVIKKDLAHASAYYNQTRHFAWVVPLASLALLLAPGLMLAGLSALRKNGVPFRAGAWSLATLALWGPLLRAPLAGAASFLLAAGLGRWASLLIFAAARTRPRRLTASRGLAVGLGLLGLTAAGSLGRDAWVELRAEIGRRQAPAHARNILLIVLDTVRAESTSLHGAARPTTPNLLRRAGAGVRFDCALAAAPWTLPSHGTLFTGRWPSSLNLHWEPALDAAVPTLAGWLASQGYRTAGFAANTNNCSWETGLARGFDHYEDYPLGLFPMLGSTVAGRWLVQACLGSDRLYQRKWAIYQSRGADDILRAFLDWLRPGRGREPRPFFAFLNLMDAHEPFVLPKGVARHFGLAPGGLADSDLLMDYWERDKRTLSPRDVALVRDAYEDAIRFLDGRVGALLDSLESAGVLRNTWVIVTSDHGEEFGERGVFNHGYSLALAETRVPLLIFGPGSTALVVNEPVSLRDLPATIADLSGAGASSPFPGRSLARFWRQDAPRPGAQASPAYAEVNTPLVLPASRGVGPAPRGFAASLVEGRFHYVRDGLGFEALYDFEADPGERFDLKNSTKGMARVALMRRSLFGVMAEGTPRSGVGRAYVERFGAPRPGVAGRPGGGG